MAIDYMQFTQTLVLRLSDLIRARRELDSKILRLQGQLRSLKTLRKEERANSPALASSVGDVGITDAIRRVFQTYPIWLTPVSVRDLLPCVDFDAGRYQDPLTSIHSILRRLVATGEVIRADQPHGTAGYILADFLRDFPNSLWCKSGYLKQKLV
jgi:hypothetical protein